MTSAGVLAMQWLAFDNVAVERASLKDRITP